MRPKYVARASIDVCFYILLHAIDRPLYCTKKKNDNILKGRCFRIRTNNKTKGETFLVTLIGIDTFV